VNQHFAWTETQVEHDVQPEPHLPAAVRRRPGVLRQHVGHATVPGTHTLLKLCGDNIVIPITYLINKSLTVGVFPSILKTASVIPLHKSGPKSDPNNYQPISILPTISKIFEKHIATQLQSFLTKHNRTFAISYLHK